MIGVIGGMGPASTISYVQRILKLSSAKKDQEHIPMHVWNDPRVPNRTNAILNNKTDEVRDYLVNIAKKMANDCLFITMPCNTAHYWSDDIQNAIDIPFINMIDETLKKINQLKYKSLTLLATKGTIQSKIYEKYSQKYSIKVKYPNETNIQQVSEIIDSIKMNNYNKEHCKKKMDDIICNIDTDCTVLGCTELSLIYSPSERILDPLDILSQKSIELWYNFTPTQ